MQNRIDSLQLLRGVAATMVAMFHLAAAADNRGPVPFPFSWMQNGSAGVDLFFVLSGFIITYTATAKVSAGPRSFLWARFLRVFPPYIAVLMLTYAVGVAAWVAIGRTEGLPGSLSEVIISVFLLPVPGHTMVIAWTLAVEMVFYLIFALTFFSFGFAGLTIAMLVWALSAQVFAVTVGAGTQLSFLLHTASAEFLYGIIIARMYLAGPLRFTKPALVVGLALFAGLMAGVYTADQIPRGREISAGVPAALIVYGLLGVKMRMPGWVMLWGESSYLLYLAHLLIFSVVGQAVMIALGIDVYTSVAWMLLLLALALGLSALATVWIERPYHRWYKRRGRA